MMVRALLVKELRQLLPWTLLIVAIELGGYFLGVLLVPPDEMTWAASAPIFTGEGGSLLLLVAALLFAYSGFPREYDDKTLPFLLSLPVTRTRLFLVKALAAGTLLCLTVLLEEALRWLMQLPNSTSFGQSFRPEWALVSAGTGVVMAWIYLGHAFFFSVFRRFGLLLGLLAYMIIVWIVHERPSWRRLNPLALQQLEFEGTVAVVPWGAFLAHAAVALVLAAISGWVWIGPTERVSSAMTRWAAKPLTRGLFGVGLAGGLIAVAVWIAPDEDAEATAAFGKIVELESPAARFESRRFEFRYPAVLRERVERLGPRADALHDAIAAKLGTAVPDGRIVVNMLQSSETHAGSATWETIRLDVVRASDDESLLHTLAHETTHVIALRASDRRTNTHHDAVRFFDEGLAEYTALEHVPLAAQRRARWLEAALLRRRLRVEFGDLVVFSTFHRRFGDAAVYPLGLVWVEALTSVCGPEAPKRVLHTLARPTTPHDASALPLWQHVLQAQRCDLSRVNARWAERIEAYAVEMRTELERIPSLVGGAADLDAGDVVLRAELEGEPLPGAAYHALIRTRAEGRDNLETNSGELVDDRLLFRLYGDHGRTDPIEFQLVIAWEREGASVAYAGEWQKTMPPRPARR